MKRILTVQDISCVGKCSITAALPIISAMGVETAILPTAVLSNHTAFKDFTFRDLTEDIEPITEEWERENIDFDAVYTGYLGTKEQIEAVKKLFRRYKRKGCLVFADPAMADDGVLYKGFADGFASEMANLCADADIIVPNLTEACLMLGIPYPGEDYDENFVKERLVSLTDLGVKMAAITGVSLEEGKIGVMSYDSGIKEFFAYSTKKIGASYHGTGDVFSSACFGALVNGYTFEDALRLAVDFTAECVRLTYENKESSWYGVDFENAIPYLLRKLRKI